MLFTGVLVQGRLKGCYSVYLHTNSLHTYIFICAQGFGVGAKASLSRGL